MQRVSHAKQKEETHNRSHIQASDVENWPLRLAQQPESDFDPGGLSDVFRRCGTQIRAKTRPADAEISPLQGRTTERNKCIF